MRQSFPPSSSSRNRSEEAAEGCALLLVTLVAMAVLWPLEGWVVSLLWEWHVVPSTGFESIGVGTGIGIAALVSMLTFNYSEADREAREFGDKGAVLGRRIGASLTVTLAALFIGWLAHVTL